jgi:hypothetical protein
LLANTLKMYSWPYTRPLIKRQPDNNKILPFFMVLRDLQYENSENRANI